jgi:transposase-like protein
MPKVQRNFTKEFKAEAVRLVEHSGKSQSQVARELGIAESNLQRRCRQYGEHAEKAFPGSGHADRAVGSRCPGTGPAHTGQPGQEGQAADTDADEHADGAGLQACGDQGDRHRIDGGQAEAEQAEGQVGAQGEGQQPDQQQTEQGAADESEHQRCQADSQALRERLNNKAAQGQAKAADQSFCFRPTEKGGSA